ncbi:MAG: hypothetical protein FJZ58_00535 [Chlamydiae bacterium]|nr:hypothetical protein [Chlamydiota bacterium]
MDLFHRVTRGGFTGEDLYNFMLCRGFHKGVNTFVTLGDRYMLARQSKIERLFDAFLDRCGYSYDIVISTVPFVNGGITRSLQKRRTPFLILPTNLDTSMFFIGMKTVMFEEEDRVLCAFPYEDSDLRKRSLQKVPFPLQRIIVTGFPVKMACQKRYSQEEVNAFKIRHGMDLERVALTVVLGAAGNRRVLAYTQRLAALNPEDFDKALEINVCVGRFEKTYHKLIRWFIRQGAEILREEKSYLSLVLHNGLIFHIRKYVQDFIEIMACSKLVITKTGSCAVNEAIYLGKKLLLDNTDSSLAGHLFWELFNLYFVRKHGLGDVFHDLSEMATLIRILLKEDLGHPVLTGAFPLPDFPSNIQQVVTRLWTKETV